MSNYELYDKVITALKADEGSFNAAARNWIEGVDEAPFDNEEAKELFSRAKYYCAAWRSKGINSRISKLRMIECVRKIAEMELGNPYVKSGFRMLGVEPEKVKLQDEEQAIQGETIKEPVQEPINAPVQETIKDIKERVKETKEEEKTRILGVVPEEKPHLFSRKKR